MRSKTLWTQAVAWMAAAALARTALAAGGGALNDPQTVYVTVTAGRPPVEVTATVTLQLVGYELNSVAGKYKLIPIRLQAGRLEKPLLLSLDEDGLVATRDGKRVDASFQLSKLDRPLWDSLSPETRNRLTYPEQLRPESAVVVYAFLPLAELKEPPSTFEYTIKSLPGTLLLRPAPPKAASLLSGEQG
jgi:hypothetical protein